MTRMSSLVKCEYLLYSIESASFRWGPDYYSTVVLYYLLDDRTPLKSPLYTVTVK